MAPSTQKGSVCSMTTGLSVNVGGDHVEKWLHFIFYLRPQTYQSPPRIIEVFVLYQSQCVGLT